VYEAQRYRCRHAAIVVHSFTGDACVPFGDLAAFAAELCGPVTKAHPISPPKEAGGIELTLAWVKDRRVADRDGLDDDSLAVLDTLRADRVINKDDVKKIAPWIDEARAFLAAPNTVTTAPDGTSVLDLDADPRNAAWRWSVAGIRPAGRRG
jgi:hypothetical protein